MLDLKTSSNYKLSMATNVNVVRYNQFVTICLNVHNMIEEETCEFVSVGAFQPILVCHLTVSFG